MNELKTTERTITRPAPNLTELNELIARYAPILYFDLEEKHKPLSVESYLNKVSLVNDSEKIKIQANQKNLPVGQKHRGRYYLEFNGTSPSSETTLQTTKVYVHAKLHSSLYTDLQFWFLFEEDGTVETSIKWIIDTITGHSADPDLGPLGRQMGCWKRITIRIDNEKREIKKLFFSQPGNGIWIDSENIEKFNNRINVYLSKNSHFFYPNEGTHYSEKLSLPVYSSVLEFSFKNTITKGDSFDCSSCYELISADYLGENKPSEPYWLNFCYPWGKEDTSYFNHKSLKEIIANAFGSKLEFLLSNSVTNELLGYLQTFFTKQLQNGSNGPKNHDCWGGDELD
ncbi:Vps62-related protein [Aurantibacillus circumpalustris]|uniref:Vps62-related protein n=1 Tax=Aurantibacillus circumpalustris TaxID=3036359 RepID=UPI00295BAC00|nr:Vps62-related protein [Aurantibacillus circumpalustris]